MNWVVAKVDSWTHETRGERECLNQTAEISIAKVDDNLGKQLFVDVKSQIQQQSSTQKKFVMERASSVK